MADLTNPSGAAPPGARVRLGRSFRRYFMTGLATLFPLWVTGTVILLIVRTADRWLGQWLPFHVPGLGLLVTVLAILVVGVFSVHFFGQVVFRALEAWVTRLPFVKKIYPAVKQLTSFLFNEESQRGFRRTVLVEYPRSGSYALAFVTNETQARVKGQPRTLLTLLVPQPPSPFTGPIIFVPAEDVIPLDMPVEDALMLIVSGGVAGSPLVDG